LFKSNISAAQAPLYCKLAFDSRRAGFSFSDCVPMTVIPRSKFLALFTALTTSVALPAVAVAQSQVTVYGVADIGISVARLGQGTQYNLAGGMEDGSRIGFKGSEDLGSGFKAIYTLESRVEVDTGAQSNGYLSPGRNQALFRGLPPAAAAGLNPAIGNPTTVVNAGGALFDRQAWVGVITPVGAVMLGRQYTPGYEVAHSADVFESGTAGSWMNLGYVNGNGVTPSLALRYNGAVQYRIETSGIIASAMVAPGSGTGTIGASKRAWSTNLIYRANALDVGVGYNSENNQVGDTALRSLVIGGSYTLGDAKLFAGYLRAKNDNPAVAGLVAPAVGPVAAAIVGQNARIDSELISLGAQYALGVNRVKVGLTHFHNRRVQDANAFLAAVGYDYRLSKRTNLYTTYAHVRNQAASQAATGGSGYLGGATSAPGQNANVLQLGVRHTF
jgi:predicted porin